MPNKPTHLPVARLWGWHVLWLALLLPLLAGANLLSLWAASAQHSLNIGFRADRHVVQGFFDQEEDARGVRYRWTSDDSTVRLTRFVAPAHAYVRLDAGGLPPGAPAPRVVQASVDGAPWAALAIDAAPRTYTLLLPPGALRDGALELRLRGPASRAEPDPRAVGMRLDRVTLGWSPGTWVLPTWQTLLVQWALLLTVLAMAWRLRLARLAMGALALGGAALLAAMTAYDPFVAGTWHLRLLCASLAVLLLVWAAFPRLAVLLPGPHPHAELRLYMLLTLAALALRLGAALYPTFDSHDWYIHEDRLYLFQFGQVVLFDKPAEFSGRLTIVPPAFYVLVAPLTLLTTNTVVTTQGLYMLLDGAALLGAALLLRQLGGSVRAAWMALLLLALFPIQLTALWWGFGPQVIGQALIVLLALLVVQPQPTRWLLLGGALLFLVIMLTHNGVMLLGGVWLSGYVGLLWLWQRPDRTRWLGWGTVVLACGALAVALLYIDIAAIQMRGITTNERLAFTEEDIFRVWWTLGSLYASFQPLNVALPLAGLLLLLVRVRGTLRWLLGTWLLSALLFLLVDLRFGLQVRYAYFSMPLVCMGLGWLLADLTRRSRLGWLLAGCLLGAVALAGLTLWYSGVVEGIKPSLRPLTH